MRKCLALGLAMLPAIASAQQPAPLLSPQVVDALAKTLSGERARKAGFPFLVSPF